MSSIFAETIAKAIFEYRQMLRRQLDQSERINRRDALNLKDPSIYESETALYDTACAIISDIEENLKNPTKTYYSYSGIATFCEELKNFVSSYTFENGRFIHRAQKAANALVKAIQLSNFPDDRLNEEIAEQVRECNELLAELGSDDQCEWQLDNLMRNRMRNETFYSPLLKHFQQLLNLRMEQTENNAVIEEEIRAAA